MYLFKDAIEMAVISATLTLSIVITLLIVAEGVSYAKCEKFETSTGYNTKWNISGCYVELNGTVVPKDYVFGKAQEIRLK